MIHKQHTLRRWHAIKEDEYYCRRWCKRRKAERVTMAIVLDTARQCCACGMGENKSKKTLKATMT